MVPTKERNVTGIFLQFKEHGILMDCGEGTQRQMNIAGINRNKVDYILISHWHGDHVSGLIGLIQTMGNQTGQEPGVERKTIHLFGPKETERRVEHMMQTCIFENKLNIVVHEIHPKRGELLRIVDKEEFAIDVAGLEHGVPCIAYRFVEKDQRRIDMKRAQELGLREGPLIGRLQEGEHVVLNDKTITPDMVSTMKQGKKIAFVLDTGMCEGAHLVAENADVLVCEASYASDIEHKAEHNKHLTAKQAALIANNANAKKLLLTHLSQRYTTGEEVLQDARDVFQNVFIAYDFMKLKL